MKGKMVVGIALLAMTGMAHPSMADGECVSDGVCPDTIEIAGDGVDDDGDGVELRWVHSDSSSDSAFSTKNELIEFAAGWSTDFLVLEVDFTLETNAMIWYLELGQEGGVTGFLGPGSGGSYTGAYPTDVEFTDPMDLMIATYGTYPLTVHLLADDTSKDITNQVDLCCLSVNCNDGSHAVGYVRIPWKRLYSGGETPVPRGLHVEIAGVIRAGDNTAPADIAPDNTASPIGSYIVLPIDTDGDGLPDQGYFDADGDGFSPLDGDCDDAQIAVYPGAPEQCNGLDDDCDGTADEGFDADGLGGSDCVDDDGDGVTEFGGDCDDMDPRVHVGAVEQCDGLDNDCDGQVDEQFNFDGIGGVDCVDDDGDGLTEFGGDCNDENPDQYAGAPEQCDGVDNDCDGRVDEGFDQDGDGTSDCVDDDGDGVTETGGDCDDTDPNVSPADEERPGNATDENCDGRVEDADGDGYRDTEGDCDDTNASIHPGAADTCDELDNDCDGEVDEGVAEICFDGVDNDCDGAIDEGAPETCDGLDNDCDGRVDNGVRYIASQGVCVTEPGVSCSLAGGSPSPASNGRTIVAGMVLLFMSLRRLGYLRKGEERK